MCLFIFFLLEEDQGVLMVQIQLFMGVIVEQIVIVVKIVQEYFMNKFELVDLVLVIVGVGVGGNSQNGVCVFICLKEWDQCIGVGQLVFELVCLVNVDLFKICGVCVFLMNLLVVCGLGQSLGFDLELKDVGGVGYDVLLKVWDQFL